jgi:hypothetical protein
MAAVDGTDVHMQMAGRRRGFLIWDFGFWICSGAGRRGFWWEVLGRQVRELVLGCCGPDAGWAEGRWGWVRGQVAAVRLMPLAGPR